MKKLIWTADGSLPWLRPWDKGEEPLSCKRKQGRPSCLRHGPEYEMVWRGHHRGQGCGHSIGFTAVVEAT